LSRRQATLEAKSNSVTGNALVHFCVASVAELGIVTLADKGIPRFDATDDNGLAVDSHINAAAHDREILRGLVHDDEEGGGALGHNSRCQRQGFEGRDKRPRQCGDLPVHTSGSRGAGINVRPADDGHRDRLATVGRQQRRLAVHHDGDRVVIPEHLDRDRPRLQVANRHTSGFRRIDEAARLKHPVSGDAHGNRSDTGGDVARSLEGALLRQGRRCSGSLPSDLQLHTAGRAWVAARARPATSG